MNEPDKQSLLDEPVAAARSISSRQPIGRRFRYPRPRRVALPVVLFLLTCVSTFWVGVCKWTPNLIEPLWNVVAYGNLLQARELLLANWQSGLIYMVSVLTILLLHEFGHFFMTLYYRVPASFPYFLPFPLNPLGTLGAVIGMQGNAADRKQIFTTVSVIWI